MYRRAGPLTSWQSVVGVMLLGVRVTAHADVNLAEHRRRAAAGIAAVIDPGLLDRLLDLPAGVPVIDPAGGAEVAGQPAGVLDGASGGVSVPRRPAAPW